MKYTPNYELRKPDETDVVDIQDLNHNADIIDQKLKEIEEKVGNVEAPVTSVNNKTGDVQLTADDVGAETPAGAQAKAEAAAGIVQQNLNAHLAETAIHKTSDVIRTETNTKLKVEVVSSSGSVTPEQGRIIFDTSKKKFFGGTGSGWV